MKKILYIVRAEADFERVVALSLYAIGKYDQYFVYWGDGFPIFNVGIKNEFQKNLFSSYNLTIRDIADYSLIGKVLKKLCVKKDEDYKNLNNWKESKMGIVFYFMLKFYLKKYKNKLIKSCLRNIKPDLLLTDQSKENSEYQIELFRKIAYENNIPVFIFTHGAAGGLHKKFAKHDESKYENYNLMVCSEKDLGGTTANRQIIGDMRTSFTYVKFLEDYIENSNYKLKFYNERKYRILFMVGGKETSFSSTNAWAKMERMIIDLSENTEVAMVLKQHPREKHYMDLRMLKKFENLKICDRESERAVLINWANIVITSDHTSTIFEPMILGKKVVALEGLHIPKFRNIHSPLNSSSVNYIGYEEKFDLSHLNECNTNDKIVDEICWGGHGPVDLSELFFKRVEEIISRKSN